MHWLGAEPEGPMCRSMQERELEEARRLGREAARALYPVAWEVAQPVLAQSWQLKGPRLHGWEQMKYAVMSGWLETAAAIEEEREDKAQ